MPKKKRSKPLYQRGPFWLDWHQRADGSRRPFLTIFWYDAARGGHRSKSTGTASLEDGKTALDAFFLEQTKGEAYCPACGQPRASASGFLVSASIADYLIGHARHLDSYEAIRARLEHVLDYLDSLRGQLARCADIDQAWIGRFRKWAKARPIVSPKGHERERSLATIEASVAQLSAAINYSYRRGDAAGPARFKIQPLRGLNQSPKHRSDIPELAAMFRYCVAPDLSAALEAEHWGRRKEPYSAEELLEIRKRERAALHRFLILSLGSLARPDAAHDLSLDPERRQWHSNARILALNPAGRAQTKKFRATIPAAWQLAQHLDAAPAKGFFVGPKSIRKAWAGMAIELGLPRDRESGEKLIRRSMGKLLRDRLPKADWPEISMFMGHSEFDQTTDIYAPFDPDYLSAARAEIERIIDEIEALCPGAFGQPASNVVLIRRKK